MEFSTEDSAFNESALCPNPCLAPFYPAPSVSCCTLISCTSPQGTASSKKSFLIYSEMKWKIKAGSYALCMDLSLSDTRLLLSLPSKAGFLITILKAFKQNLTLGFPHLTSYLHTFSSLPPTRIPVCLGFFLFKKLNYFHLEIEVRPVSV